MATIISKEEKIEMLENGIRTAIKDYGRHCYDQDVLEDVSDEFIERLARDSYDAKAALRDLFRKSPAWHEELDAIVINGNRTHNTDYRQVRHLIYQILALRDEPLSYREENLLDNAFLFFTSPDPTDEELEQYTNAINELAPGAYVPGKKKSRVFLALANALGVVDNTKGSEFQRLYAQLADELSARQLDFKLFVSINPAHFITMSNPLRDSRGAMLNSCHTFNRTDYEYNNGCTGYARDGVTFIVFTVDDPTNPELLNNRKTSRQIFCYLPGNGVLLQSRLYNTHGGTNGAQAESKLYRDLIQREISDLEGAPNLWNTFRYCGQNRIHLNPSSHFGGYTDWEYDSVDAKVSIRKDHEDDYKEFEIGEYGICIVCGCENTDGVYCEDCGHANMEYCDWCDEWHDSDDMYDAYDRHGNAIRICEDCRDDNFTWCEVCESYHHNDVMHETADGEWVCDDCLERYYIRCEECGEWVRSDDAYSAIDCHGYEVYVCDGCRYNYYTECEECGQLVSNELIEGGLCPDCIERLANEKKEEIA